MTDLKRIKQIHDRHKLIVFGYNHKAEKQLSILNVPAMISYLCLCYYFQENYFEKCQGNIKVSQDKKTVTYITGDSPDNTFAECKTSINRSVGQLTKWTLKINKISAAHRMKFWIFTKRSDRHLEDDIYLFDGGNITNTDGPGNAYRVPRNLKTGDILTIILNTKDRTIGFIKNKEELKIIWRNIRVDSDFAYNLRVQLKTHKDSVSMIHFASDYLA